MKEGKEKNGGTATSFVDPALFSSGSGTHPHRGEVRLPVVDDRLPVLCLPSNAIQLLRPSFYIVKLVGRGFRSLIPLPRSVSPFLSSEPNDDLRFPGRAAKLSELLRGTNIFYRLTLKLL